MNAWPFTRRQPQDLPNFVQHYLNAPKVDEYTSWRNVPYSVLDIETTGLNPRRDAILSIGMVDIESGRVRLDRQWYSLLKPPEGMVVPAESLRIHGLLRREVARARSPEEVLPEILDRLMGRTLIVHFAPIDIDFLNRALRDHWGIGLRGPAIDTVRLAQTIYHNERWTTGHDGAQMATALSPLAQQAGIPIHNEHNALGDALTTAQLFLVQATRLEQLGGNSLRRLLKAGRCLR